MLRQARTIFAWRLFAFPLGVLGTAAAELVLSAKTGNALGPFLAGPVVLQGTLFPIALGVLASITWAPHNERLGTGGTFR